MSEWRECCLGELCEITSSKRIFYNEYVSAGVPFYRSKEIIEKANRNNISTELFITNEKYDEIKIKFGVPKKGDILMTSVGTLGVPYVIKDDEKFYFKDGNLTWLKPQKNIYSMFLYYYLISNIGKQKLDEITIGSTQEALTISGIKTIDINLPSFPEQKAIAEILSSIDDKIDLLNRQNKTLEALAETYFRQWFIEKADEEWEKKSLHKVLNIMGGGTPKTSVADYWNGTIPWFTPKDAKGIFCVQTEKYITNKGLVNCNSRLFDIGTIFVSARGTVGKVAIAGVPMAMNQSCYALCGEGKLSNWIVYLLLKESIREIQVNASGAVFDAIVTDTFKAISLSLPDLTDEIFSKFDSLVEPLFRKVQSNTSQIQTLQMLGDTLLPKLISGEVRVEMRGVQ